MRHVWQGDEDCGLEIGCEVMLSYGKHIPTLIRQAQEKVREAIEYMTGMIVRQVNITVKALYVGA